MTKEEFMTKLEQELQGISYEERQAALRYYEEYFEEAGQDAEAMSHLESPESIAQAIKDDIDIKMQLVRSSGKEKNSAPNTGQEQSQGQEQKSAYNNKADNSNTETVNQVRQEKSSMSGGKIALIVIVCIIASPILFGSLGSLLGIAAALIGTFFAFFIGGAGLVIAGGICFVTSFITMFESVVYGFLQMGISFLLISLGLVMMAVVFWFAGSVIPMFINWIRGLGKTEDKGGRTV